MKHKIPDIQGEVLKELSKKRPKPKSEMTDGLLAMNLKQAVEMAIKIARGDISGPIKNESKEV